MQKTAQDSGAPDVPAFVGSAGSAGIFASFHRIPSCKMIIPGRTGLAQSYQGGVKILMALPDRTPSSSTSSAPAVSGLRPIPRRFGRINWVGLQTLYLKEVRRFLAVWTQTLLAPMVTTLLFLAVFTLALGGGRTDMSIGAENISFSLFL